LPSLLQRRCSLNANQTLHDVWPSPGPVLYVYIFGGSCPWQNFARCKIHFTSKSCVLLFWQRYCTAQQQWALAKLCGVVQGMELRNFHRGRHLYLAGRPSRWASAPHSSLSCNVLCRKHKIWTHAGLRIRVWLWLDAYKWSQSSTELPCWSTQSVNDETTIAKTASYCQWKLICVLQVKICSEHLQLSMVSSFDFLLQHAAMLALQALY